MFTRVADFIRSEEAYRTTELPRGEVLETRKRPFAHPNSDRNSRGGRSYKPYRGTGDLKRLFIRTCPLGMNEVTTIPVTIGKRILLWQHDQDLIMF